MSRKCDWKSCDARSNTLSRRTVLRGVGVALSLPWLSAIPSRALARSFDGVGASNSVEPARRLAYVFFPNGVIPGRWKPEAVGPLTDLPSSLAPLADLRDRFSVLSGLAQVNAYAQGDGGGDHARNAGTYLTGVHPVKSTGADIRAGVSIDQVAADHLGRATRLRSIELSAEASKLVGSCDQGYSCAYTNTISWRTPTRPNPTEVDPRRAFERLFGRPGGPAQAERIASRRSVLDFVLGEADRIRTRVGAEDRARIDEYFASVRDLERRIERQAALPEVDRPDIDVPDRIPTEAGERIRLMFDLLALAFQADLTRVGTLMVAKAISNRRYPEIGVRGGHHQLSHHRNDPETIEQIAKIDRFFVEQFARFLRTLRDTPEGEGAGSLLDRTLIVYGSALNDGNRHTHHDLPILVAGGGDRVVHGRHIAFPDRTPLCNLFLSTLDYAGVPEVDRFGDSTDRLNGLLS